MTVPSDRVFYELTVGKGLERKTGPVPEPGPDEAVVEIAGCGVCHTDIGFLEGGVRPAKDPVVLGHEVAGTVVATGDRARAASGKDVVVPAVLPCGECALCGAGRGNVCAGARMLGSHIDGGFATHIVLPARSLVPVDLGGSDLKLWEISVVADAVTTPLQAITRAQVAQDDRVVVVGVGGLGAFAVQIAHARGAEVIGVDVDAERLTAVESLGAKATVETKGLDERATRKKIRDAAASLGWRREAWKVFEMSGTTAGQRTAFDLLTPRGMMGVVGFTPERTAVRLSNVMALEAELFGTWGAPPERYPEAVQLLVSGDVALRPFVRGFPLSSIQQVLADVQAGRLKQRAIFRPAEGA